MNKAQRQLYLRACALCKERLTGNQRYADCRQQRALLLQQFCTELSPDTREQYLDLNDLSDELQGMEKELLFLLGLQLGMGLSSPDLL